MSRPPLRVGLLVDSLRQPRWVETILKEIAASPEVARVVLVMRNGAEAPPRSLREKLRARRHYLLLSVFERLDRRRCRVEPDPFAMVDVKELLGGCPVISVVPRMTKQCDYFSDDDAERIRAHDLDVALRLGFRILKGGALGIARYGVWSYHHGDNLRRRGSPPGFWEVLRGDPVTGSILQVLTEELDAGRVIYRSWSRTQPHSVHRNRIDYYWKTATFVMRKLRDLHREGSAALRDPWPQAEDWSAYSERLYVAPRNREMAGLLVRHAGRYLRAKVDALVHEWQWVLAWRLTPGGGDVPDRTLYRFRPLLPPRDRFWADPFPVHADGRHLVFLEEWLNRKGKAHISVMEFGADGRWTTPTPVLERDYHLSYPFTFRWGGGWYMLPETGMNRTVEIYRAVSFPHRWELEAVLLAGLHAVDATVMELEGRWWMFVNVAVEGGSTLDELHLYHAPAPLGPWTPHRRNPVKSDVRNARPAGRLFRWNGRLYRPAQDSSGRYGYAIVMNRVERLDEEEFCEQAVGRIYPAWDPRFEGTHTINAAGGLTVVDAWMKRTRW